MIRSAARRVREEFELTRAARDQRRRDRRGLPEKDPGVDRVLDEGVAWLCRAQDSTASGDDGIAGRYSLIDGWLSSYPETSGYIVPTLLDYARLRNNDSVRKRAFACLDWLVDIQLPGGGYQGGMLGQKPVVPVVFNTGQVLIGLAHGAREEPAYLEPMRRAAEFLVECQDEDGAWRRYRSPFAESGEKTYETHVAWGLCEAERSDPGRGFGEAALRNVRWALGHQRDNGWFELCGLLDDRKPLTHTLGYVLRGVIEGYRLSRAPELLERARRTADGMLRCLDSDGSLPGRLDCRWRGSVSWVCLTGLEQVAWSWLQLYAWTGEERYRDAAFRANAFVRRTIDVDGPPEVRGAVKGSFPVDGEYLGYEYPNWAVKFTVDANLFERDLRAGCDLRAG